MCPKNLKEIKLKKILIIGKENIGENLLMTPAIKKIRGTFPDALIDIIIGPASQEFAEGNPWFSGYLLYKKNPLEFIKSARSKRYDLIISFANPLLPYVLRGKYRLSFFFNSFFSEKTFTHESERFLKYLEPFLGKEEEPRIDFPLSNKEREVINGYLRESGIKNSDILAVIGLGTDAGRREWSRERFAKTLKEIIKRYDAKIILTGIDNKSKKSAEKIKKLFNSRVLYDYTERLSLKETAALFERADVIITESITYIHLAASVKSPVVAIYGAGNPYRFGPIWTKNIIVRSNLECFPCKVTKKCRKNFVCLEEISVDKVSKTIGLMLREKEQPLLFDLWH